VSASGAKTSEFTTVLSTSAVDDYEPDRDVKVPPAPPAGFKQIRFGSETGGETMLIDYRDEPALGQTKVWPCIAEMVNFGDTECRNVTVAWDLSEAGEYQYTFYDAGAGTTLPMMAGGDTTFYMCDGDTPAFELQARKIAFSPADFNEDGYVNQDDLAVFTACMTGADQGPVVPGCEQPDFDRDGDVDLDDFGDFQICISGTEFADPTCPEVGD
jgi:hypothetical protein